LHPTDQHASFYAATKKAGEEIAHTYNHIYGLSLTDLSWHLDFFSLLETTLVWETVLF